MLYVYLETSASSTGPAYLRHKMGRAEGQGSRPQAEMCGPFLLSLHLVTSNGQSMRFLPLSSSLSVLPSYLLLGFCWNPLPGQSETQIHVLVSDSGSWVCVWGTARTMVALQSLKSKRGRWGSKNGL